jgi:hypothetical protein
VARRSVTLHYEEADRPLLPVTESVVHEWKLAGHVAYKLEYHPATRSDVPGLHSLDRRKRRRAKISRVELLSDNVKIAGMRRACVHDPESHAVTDLRPDRILDVLIRPPVERDEIGHRGEHLLIVECAKSIDRVGEIKLALHEHEFSGGR